MLTVHRFQLNDASYITPISMPRGAKVFSFGWQQERACFSVWAMVDTEAEGQTLRRFAVVGTGQPLPSMPDCDVVPIGSAVLPDGFHIFHCFEFVPE